MRRALSARMGTPSGLSDGFLTTAVPLGGASVRTPCSCHAAFDTSLWHAVVRP